MIRKNVRTKKKKISTEIGEEISEISVEKRSGAYVRERTCAVVKEAGRRQQYDMERSLARTGRAKGGGRRADGIQGGHDVFTIKLSEGDGGNPCQCMGL